MLEYLINSQDPEIAEKYDLRSGIGLAANQVNSLKSNVCTSFRR